MTRNDNTETPPSKWSAAVFANILKGTSTSEATSTMSTQKPPPPSRTASSESSVASAGAFFVSQMSTQKPPPPSPTASSESSVASVALSTSRESIDQNTNKNKFKLRRVLVFAVMALILALGFRYDQKNVQSLLSDHYSTATTAVEFAVRNGTTDTISRLPTFDDKDSFSACLLLMDDNHRLPEWLAYHFWALPLRHLVVAVDPHSKTSPSEILDRWRDKMAIELWTNDSFTGKDLMIKESDNSQTRTTKHRNRQGLFYQACVRHLQKQNRTWTAFHDVDEFLTVNGDVVKGATDKVHQPGSVLQVVKTYSETAKEDRREDVPGQWYNHYQQSACVTIARILVSAVESSHDEIANGVPSLVDPMRFDTLRWRYRHSKRGGHDGPAKSIIDVSRVGPKHFGKFSAHKPLKRICPGAFIGYNKNPLGIYHYLGSWEAYSFREDARDGLHHTADRWRQKAEKKDGGVDDHMRHWIAGFVKMVGEDSSNNLLRDAGLPPGYKHNSTLALKAMKSGNAVSSDVVVANNNSSTEKEIATSEEAEDKLPLQPADNTTNADLSSSEITGEEDPVFKKEELPDNLSNYSGLYEGNTSSTLSFTQHLVPISKNDTFSACLLLMDDNHRLPEWLAYHFWALPLRHLVVAVDPHSKTSPSEILDRWRDKMTIELWTNDSFTGKDLMIKASDDSKTRTTKHRNRQGLFYQACVRHLQKQNRTWTAFHDVDEFLTVNGDVVKNATDKVHQPGSVLQVVKTYSETAKEDRREDVPGYWYNHYQRSACVTIARILVSAVESSHNEIANGVPSLVDPMQFDTLRWRYRHSKRGRHDGPAKSIIDVSRVGPKDFGRFSAHKPLKRICPSAFVEYNKNPLGIYHYLGSWESYSFREDARDGLHHTYDRWMQKAKKKSGGADDHMRQWISGFVDMVGEDSARHLFDQQGLPTGLKSNSTLARAAMKKTA